MFSKGSPTPKKSDVMSRNETALWLGRSLSTNDLTLRTIIELLSIISFQQRMIQALYEKVEGKEPLPDHPDPYPEMEKGATDIAIKKLAATLDELTPVLKVVDEALEKLQKEI